MDPATLPTLSPTIDCDLQCLTCGYNLRTLRRDGLCPECGSPVADSLHTWLAGRDRRWLSLMAWGASLLFPVPLLLVLQIFTDFLHWEWHILALGAAITAGLWLLASRDRRAQGPDRATVRRLFIRLCAIATLACYAIQAIGPLRSDWRWFPSWFVPPFVNNRDIARVCIPYVILAASYISVFAYLAAIAGRLGNRRLAILSIVSLALTAGPLLLLVTMAFIDWPDNDWAVHLLAASILTASWANVVFGRFVQIFRQAASQAPLAIAPMHDRASA